MSEIMILNEQDKKLMEVGFDAMSIYEKNNMIVRIGTQNNVDYESIIEEDVLTYHKKIKLYTIKEECELKIIKGFTSKLNNHFYRTNRDDQVNMIGQKDYLDANPEEATVFWKTEDEGYIEHTREDWIKIYNEAFAYKKSILLQYNVLKQKIENATTDKEVLSYGW